MIEYSLVTDEWRIGIRDGGDSDRLPDIEPLKALATLTPVTAQMTTAPGEGGDSWNLLLAPITVTYADGRLVGTDGVDGVKVISAINGRPVSWRVERTLTWENQRIPVPTIVVAPMPGQRCHLPDAVPTSPDVNVRQVFITMAEIDRALADARMVSTEASRSVELVAEAVQMAEAAKVEAETILSTAQEASAGVAIAVDSARGHADRAESAAGQVDAVVADAVGAVRGHISADVEAAESARDGAVAAKQGAEDARDQAGVHAQDANGSAVTASATVATIGSHVEAASAAKDSAAQHAAEAKNHADNAVTAAGIAAMEAARQAARTEIEGLVGTAPKELDTIWELADAVRNNQDGLAGINAALANRVTGTYSVVAQRTTPQSPPSNQITLVMGTGWEPPQ